MSSQLFDLMIKDLQQKKSAFLDDAQTNRQNQAHKITLDLGKDVLENDPFAVNFPFKSVFVESSTDAACVVYLRATSKEDHQTVIPFRMRDGWNIDYQVPCAFLHWPKQVGKTMTLMFFPDSSFNSGSNISVTSGGVSVSDGSIIATPAKVAIPATTTTVIAPANPNRKVATLEATVDLWIGGPGVLNAGATQGLFTPAGARITLRNTGALYGYSTGAGDVIRVEEE